VSRACRLAFGLLLAAAMPAFAQTVAPPAPGSDVIRETELDRMTKEVAAQLRCVVCQGLSIQDSPSSLAQEMRALVREQLELGKSPDEVKEYFVEKYGEWVLLRPKARGFNLLVYVMPVLILLGGGVFVFSKARKWTNAAPPEIPVEDEVEAQQY
jgi:cytochrome c-type biogenesis protein CcmH